MMYIKVFVSSTKAYELMSILNGMSMIPMYMWENGSARDGKMWIKFAVEGVSWDKLKAHVDMLNSGERYVMPCEIEVYDNTPEGGAE